MWWCSNRNRKAVLLLKRKKNQIYFERHQWPVSLFWAKKKHLHWDHFVAQFYFRLYQLHVDFEMFSLSPKEFWRIKRLQIFTINRNGDRLKVHLMKSSLDRANRSIEIAVKSPVKTLANVKKMITNLFIFSNRFFSNKLFVNTTEIANFKSTTENEALFSQAFIYLHPMELI